MITKLLAAAKIATSIARMKFRMVSSSKRRVKEPRQAARQPPFGAAHDFRA